MTVDYPGAVDMIITDPAWVFTDALINVPNPNLTVVEHKTANNGATSAQGIAQFFHNDTAGHKSVHFVVGRDGTVVQVVALKDGAGGNCCLEGGHDPYWDRLVTIYPNLNTCTYSIEHVDESVDNSQAMTPAQIDASNKLNLWLMQKFHLNLNQFKSHSSMLPRQRARCPGPTFSFSQLFAYLVKNGSPPSPSSVRAQAALDTWNYYGLNLPVSTGIALAWFDLYVRQGVVMPPPTGPERKTTSWQKLPIIFQMFGNLRCEWDGSAHWIMADGGV